MNLFIFFALPIATILLSIVLQKILRSPILVAITFFAIYLIVAFAAFSDTLAEALIATIIYTIIAYITANIVMLICRLKRRLDCLCGRNHNSNRENISNMRQNLNRCSCGNDNDSDTESNNLLRISCRCGDSDVSSDLLTVNSSCLANNSTNRSIELNEEEILSEVPTNTVNTAQNRFQNRPVALGNNIVNKSNMQRRYYNRRW